MAFSNRSTTLSDIHVLDLDKKGCIKPHVDSVRVSNLELYFMYAHLLYSVTFILDKIMTACVPIY